MTVLAGLLALLAPFAIESDWSSLMKLRDDLLTGNWTAGGPGRLSGRQVPFPVKLILNFIGWTYVHSILAHAQTPTSPRSCASFVSAEFGSSFEKCGARVPLSWVNIVIPRVLDLGQVNCRPHSTNCPIPRYQVPNAPLVQRHATLFRPVLGPR